MATSTVDTGNFSTLHNMKSLHQNIYYSIPELCVYVAKSIDSDQPAQTAQADRNR